MLSPLVITTRSRVRAVALLLAGLVLVGTGTTVGAVGAAVGTAVGAPAKRWVPPGDTIVGVSGSVRDGFTVSRYDGSTLFPPTGSEARAECGELDRRIARVRCRVEVATWYRDLGDLKLSLRWARRQ